MTANTNQFDKLLAFTNQLDEKQIWYCMDGYRQDAISVLVAAPGERWEVNFLEDGTIDVEVFRSDGNIADESALERLLAIYSEDASDLTPRMKVENGAVLHQ